MRKNRDDFSCRDGIAMANRMPVEMISKNFKVISPT